MTAIYARQSVDKKDSISIDTQIELCRNEAAAGEEIRVYADRGFSGKNTDRPSFKSLMDDVKDGLVKRIIVYRLDRISRSITDFANIIDYLEKYHVDFVSTTEKFDTATPMGKAMLYIIMVFAQLERETIAQRIKDNYYSRGKSGVWLGGPAPYGFEISRSMLNGKKISVIKPTKDIDLIQLIFHEYATTTKSLGAIAKDIRNTSDEMWNNIKLSRILHNPAYVKANVDVYNFYAAKKCILINDIEEFTGEKGLVLYGKRDRGKSKYRNLDEHVVSIGLHDGIIEPDIWLKCQSKLDSNRQIKNTGKGKHSWLSGLIKCGYCNYSMNVKVYKETKYFSCTGRYIKKGICKDVLETHYIQDIEDTVYASLKKYISDFNSGQIRNNVQKDSALKLNALKIELQKVQEQIDNLINSIAESNNTLLEYINKKIVQLDEQRMGLMKEINACAIPDLPLKLPDISNWTELDMASKHEIAAGLMNKVSVFDDEINIEWRY